MSKGKIRKHAKIIVVGAVIIALLVIFLGFSASFAKIKRPNAAPRQREMAIAVEFEKSPPVRESREKQKVPKKTESKIKQVVDRRGKSAKSATIAKSTGGALPPIKANYRRYVGFKKYAEIMSSLGAVFVIADGKVNKLLRIDFRAGSLEAISLEKLKSGDFSPRTRLIDDEPFLASFLGRSKRKYGMSSPEIILLVPRSLENHIAYRTRDYFKATGIDPEKLTGLYGTYLISNGGLVLRLTRAVAANGASRRINLSVRMGNSSPRHNLF